jgi:hypothetical protein
LACVKRAFLTDERGFSTMELAVDEKEC